MPEQVRDDAGNGGDRARASQALFSREMPGGGSVRVELVVIDHDAVGQRVSGRVVMRPYPLADMPNEMEMVVEELEGDDADDVVPELLRIARDNAAIARRVLRQRGEEGPTPRATG